MAPPPFITLFFLAHSVHVSWLIVSKRLEEAVRHDALVTVKNKEYLHVLQFKKIYYLFTPGVWPTMLQSAKRGANSLPLSPLTLHPQENSTVTVC